MFRQKKNSIFHPAVISLMVFSLLLNVLLSMAVRRTGLPFYIDTVGTIAATALGGIVPGIITAFATNAVNFFMDGESIFYASLNMLIAIVTAAWFGDYARYKRIKKYGVEKKRSAADLIFYVLILALIGGGIGGAITWFLYEASSDAPMSVAIYDWLGKHLGLGPFGSHMVSTCITDLMDKAISLAAALLLIRITPAKVKDYVRLSAWRQTPLSFDEQETAKRKLKSRMPIGLRINLILVISTMLVTVIAVIFSISSFRETTIEVLSSDASQIAYLASELIDPERVEAYLEMGYAARGYDDTRKKLEILKNSSPDIAFLYVYRIEKDGCHVVFDLNTILSDGSYVFGESPGSVVEYEEAYLPYLDELLAGKMLPTVKMDDQYGNFIASYYPVYDYEGNCVCYAVSNVEYRRVNELIKDYAGRVLLIFSGFILLIVAISILTTKYHIVMPIMSMTLRANEMVDESGATEEELDKIENMDIHTGDEVEQLYNAFCRMTGETVYQLKDNKNKSESITKMQSTLLITMADMVESRDSDTGAHVLKTAAYVRIILEGLKRNGYYAEKLSDRYMRDVEMSAPLHDVGKINIPDAVLNKPGKLTDEEFEIMKTHTTAGKSILENAISSMEGDNYLKEARNMAAYHHERWDGKGYPEGLHGEVIPLSARVMAVADVFDALSSPRVYKPAFPFDKAVEIIKEGSGTQFDPKCVEVFMESLTEVKKVLKKYQEI